MAGQTDLLLASAMYLKAVWREVFEPAMPAAFHVSETESITVDMMHKTGEGHLRQVGDMRLLVMQCYGGINAIFILPDAISGLGDAEAWLAEGHLDDTLRSMGVEGKDCRTIAQVDVWLPKFTIDSSLSLGPMLGELGLTDAFMADEADFSGLIDDLTVFLGVVDQRAYISIDEKGIEGAAGGALDFLHGPKAEPTEFRADHPFLFVVHHGTSGQVLFIGRVVRPQESEQTQTPE